MSAFFKVNEIFESIQGEGLLIGKPMNFIRFSRCNLSCRWCDTRFEEGKNLKVEEIISRLNKKRTWVSLTGGEPMLENLMPLIEILHKEGYRIMLETNSTIYDKKILDNVDHISADIKPPSSGNPIWNPKVIRYCKKNPEKSQIKVVIQDNRDVEFFKQIYDSRYPNWILQPQAKKIKEIDYIRLIENTPENARIIPQIHKIIGVK